MNKKHYASTLYWKISAALLLTLALVGLGYFFISSFTARQYLQEANQRLYGDIASYMVEETKPIVDGKVDTAATHDIMHSMMVINRSVEVYILDTEGTIIDYVVPFTSVKLDKVDIAPVLEFLDHQGDAFVLGDDPKQPKTHKVFSAAPIHDNEQLAGYAYIILASEEQETVFSNFFGSYMLKMSTKMFSLALVVALLIGLAVIWLITRNLNQVIETARRFKEGDYAIRVPASTDGGLAILRDTFNEMADTLEANIEQLKSMDRLRQELIANVSHDLRTPLALTQGYLETLQMKEGQLTAEERQQYLKIAHDSSEKLAHLVAQLFEYSKLEAKQIEPQKEPFLVSELLQDVATRYKIMAEDKQIDIQLGLQDKLPLVFADVGLVERAIQNLLDNAIKFTPRGGTIKIELSNQREGVEVRISDTGPGIPLHEQSQIFERYRQAPPHGNIKQKGAGLGLAIVKKIMEIHDATIRVQSKPEQGTAFWFCLPAYQA